MPVKIFTTGGTIDKVYFDAKSDYEVGEPTIHDILEEAHVTLEHEVESILRKDSLEMTDEDRATLVRRVREDPARRVLITHGTDTMSLSARALQDIDGKVIVLTGALHPARFKSSDAAFNVGFALAAVQALDAGVYLTMNGQIFHPEQVRKNRTQNRFEAGSE